MRVLVTGGRGFIGAHVAREALVRGHAVRVLCRPTSSSSADTFGAEVVRHDLRDSDGLAAALRGVDAVIHCAAAMGGEAHEQHADTVVGTQNLLHAMDREGVSNIVAVSTFAVYDYTALAPGSTLDERSPLEADLAAAGPYVATKREQEDLIRSTASQRGWRWTIVRPGIVFGPGRTWFYHLGVKLRSSLWLSYAGASLFPLTYVENLADALVRVLQAEGSAGATVNIVDDSLPSRVTYLRMVADSSGHAVRILDIPWDVLEPAATGASWVNRRLFGDHLPLPDVLRRKRLHNRCKPLRYTNERAKALIGWTPRFDLQAGLERSL